MTQQHHTPDHDAASFSRTNPQTIAQRVEILKELLPELRSIAEICAGDCLAQRQAYQQAFPSVQFRALDIDPVVVALNQRRTIDCQLGDALNAETMRSFLSSDVIFFGPPLSEDCVGHRFFAFQEVSPSFRDFTSLLYGELTYQGTVVCIGSKQTSMGDWRWLYEQLKAQQPDIGLRLIHNSYSTLTGRGETTAPRLKYVEGWFSTTLGDQWEARG